MATNTLMLVGTAGPYQLYRVVCCYPFTAVAKKLDNGFLAFCYWDSYLGYDCNKSDFQAVKEDIEYRAKYGWWPNPSKYSYERSVAKAILNEGIVECQEIEVEIPIWFPDAIRY